MGRELGEGNWKGIGERDLSSGGKELGAGIGGKGILGARSKEIEARELGAGKVKGIGQGNWGMELWARAMQLGHWNWGNWAMEQGNWAGIRAN